MKFTERKMEILKEVVDRFIAKADPVSSRKIAQGSEFDLSSATIRKEMSELEVMGYLTHPHTSAGRTPTDKGYRFYVDNVIKEELDLSADDGESSTGLDITIGKDMEIETILQKSAEILAKFTNYLSMIVAPTIQQSKFKHIELLKFHGGNLLMVLITDTGRVYKRSFVLGGKYTDLDLQGVTNILNLQLRDKKIIDIGMEDIKIQKGDSYLILLVNRIIELIKECIKEDFHYNRIFIHGTSVILQQPEFIDLKKIQNILRVIENEYLLMKLLMDFSEDKDFIVKIGSELFEEGTEDLSLIASKYKIYGNSTGAIGVLGPKRMDYSRVIRNLNLFRKNLTEIFNSRA
ncbi:MAG: heat-inducible transcriptional repressor HrcA [Actinobacteria bacterium]|nr:heat-inducible transcriptional repressor HrcA [Actinomycetota bacterium]MBU4483424.1 heat-inducible transcriptional repressor HrcA [Actinomycetota bacterium]